RRRDRAQLHGERRRAQGLRHRAARRGTPRLQRAADRIRRRRRTRALRGSVREDECRRRTGRERIPYRHAAHPRSQGVLAPNLDRDPPMKLEQVDSLAWDKGDGLLPAVVQDARSGTVLMLGYMNREALRATLSEGRVTFFSRSKDRLWTKGETSGH